MNANIIVNPASIKYPGYTDVPIQQFVMSDSKYNNLFLGEVISYLEYQAAINFVMKCLDQLETGGYLIIQNIDVVEIAQKITNGEMDFRSINQILSQRLSFHSMFSLLDSIDSFSRKFETEIKDIENLNFILHLRKT